jgi:hypothetical protein
MVQQVQLDLQVQRVRQAHKEFKASRVMLALLDQSVQLDLLVLLDHKELQVILDLLALLVPLVMLALLVLLEQLDR